MTSSMKPKQPASYKHAKADPATRHKSAKSDDQHTAAKADDAEKSTKKQKKGQHEICPRCREKKISVVTQSPVANVWTVYGCETCLYVWRDTETEAYTEPDHYPEAFRIDPKSLSELGDMPNIPPLRKKGS